MDKAKAVGERIHFRKVFTSTPTLLVAGGEKSLVFLVNETASAVRIGHSGTVATLGLHFSSGATYSDEYSKDEYWGYVPSGSGTISGYVVP